MRASTSARTSLIAMGGAIALLSLAACGGSSSSSDSTSSAAPAASGAAAASAAASGGTGTGDRRAAFAAYRDCMSKNGVTLPDFNGPRPGGAAGAPPSGAFNGPPPSGAPGNGGPRAFPLPSGVDQATFDKAQKACASLRPQFGAGGPRQIDATALAAFKSCLGDHDVKVPDGQDFMRQLDRTDPKVSAALKTCAPLLPQPGAPAQQGAPAASPSPAAS